MKKQIINTIAFAILLAMTAFAQQPTVTVSQSAGQAPVEVVIKQAAQNKPPVVRPAQNNLMKLVVQEINEKGEYSFASREIWSNLAKFIETNTKYKPIFMQGWSTDDILKSCLEYGGDREISRVQCSPNNSLLFVDISPRVKFKEIYDKEAAKHNRKVGIFQTIVQIVAPPVVGILANHGKYQAAQAVDYGAFYSIMRAQASLSPTKSIEIVVKVDIDNFGFFDTTAPAAKRIDRRMRTFSLNERFREYRLKIYADGNGEFIETVFNGEPTNNTPDGKPGQKYDDITLPLRGVNFGQNWMEMIESIALIQCVNELTFDATK